MNQNRRPTPPPRRPYQEKITEPAKPVEVRFRIQDLRDATNPTVTEFIAVDASLLDGHLVVQHADNTGMIIKMVPGWCLTTEPLDS
jgi:hypothetical protein